MEQNDNERSSISRSGSIQELAEFWDVHDATDFDDQTCPVEIEFDIGTRRHYIAIAPELIAELRKVSQTRGISLETLVNLWLQEQISTKVQSAT